jgi:hypothetical protein
MTKSTAATRRREQPRGPTVQGPEAVHRLGRGERIDHGRVPGYQRTHRDALAGEHRREGAGDVAEATGLDQRMGLGGHGQNAEVMRQDGRSSLRAQAVWLLCR